MANSIILVLSSLLAFLSLHADAASPNDVVSTVCPKTSNPGFCASVLKSAGSPDLARVAAYTLNLARTNAAQSLSLARSLAKTSETPLKQCYSACSVNYDEAVGEIEQAQNYLAVGDYNGVNVEASAVMTEVGECDGTFRNPPADTSSLTKNGKTLEDLCSIILVISNLLPTSM
ncbi:pectinesterase inhibitor-like [Momordica charantia]|uniref:Pectinesterase inhibitor-like n=1 Tax=Momordica charantia TaxID=3673 RepID=A0A6J1CDG8_MOMCH|nr:pectinesterase inhibitor-like [Momordica charantia]